MPVQREDGPWNLLAESPDGREGGHRPGAHASALLSPGLGVRSRSPLVFCSVVFCSESWPPGLRGAWAVPSGATLGFPSPWAQRSLGVPGVPCHFGLWRPQRVAAASLPPGGGLDSSSATSGPRTARGPEKGLPTTSGPAENLLGLGSARRLSSLRSRVSGRLTPAFPWPCLRRRGPVPLATRPRGRRTWSCRGAAPRQTAEQARGGLRPGVSRRPARELRLGPRRASSLGCARKRPPAGPRWVRPLGSSAGEAVCR